MASKVNLQSHSRLTDSLKCLERVILYTVNRLDSFSNEHENNVSQKISDARSAKVSRRYEQEQGESARGPRLCSWLKKPEGNRMDIDTFSDTVRRHTNTTEITRRADSSVSFPFAAVSATLCIRLIYPAKWFQNHSCTMDRPHRRRKLHIPHFRLTPKARSFRCGFSPHKA